MTLAPGTRLGPYEIVAPLGAGGMGEVYRARDPRLGREVAIKVLPASVAANPERLARLEREARTVASLNHPNIVTLHSLEESGEVRFLTMELVDGQTLDGSLVAGGLPMPRALEIATALADALAAAHDKGVVHRDLKPANVMVTGEGRIKVLDFGLAKLALSDSDLEATLAATMAAPLSSPGQAVGTVPYMAPEQVRGEAVDGRTDLFAFGIVLFELFTGRRPFTGTTPADVTSAILRDTPPRVLTLRPELPRDLDRIVARCLEKDPRDRFQTARDVYNDLRYLWREVDRSGAPGSAPASTSSAAAHPASGPPSSSSPGSAYASSAPPSSTASRETSPSIAVLPFVNRSRDEEDEYFADGLTDELLNVLAKIRGLRVSARTSAFQFKGKHEDLAVIGQKLNVATLLEGTVRRSGNRVRITVQLIKVADGFHLWSETYDRTLDDIFAVQDDIAQSVVKELRAALLDEAPDSKASGEVRAEVAAAAKGRGENAEAHRLFLQGRFFVNRLAEQDLAQGIALLRQALSVEPGHALAWACLSWAETVSAISTTAALEDGIARAREAASRAMALEPDLAEGHLAMGWIRLWYDFDWNGAEASFRRAFELASGNAEVMLANAMMAHILGRYDEALSICRRALEQDPLSVPGYGFVARVYHAMERLPEAEAAFRKALEISPEATSLHCLLALVLDAQGRRDEADAEASKESAEWARLFAQAIIRYNNGRPEDSKRALEHLVRIGAGSAAYQIAVTHAVRGEVDAAFEWLERAYAQRDSGLAFIRGHWILRPVHGDPRWQPFVKKMGFPD